MDSGFTNFHHLDSIVRRALELPPDARDDFLQEACASDAGLLARAREILSLALDEAGGLTPGEGLRALGAMDAVDKETAASAGERFGPWRILDEIGSGGMAKVYRAERADGAYHQQVAVKLLYRTGDTGVPEKRFEHERSLLARLEHPSIARLLDGGTTEDGRSYIVMEYIEGERIDRYCDVHKLSIEARLNLFLQVCEAVQFAHRQLIVHRDIKPANILVTTDGAPKLLDFGIAKLLETDGQVTNLTQTILAHRMLTPQYASPEQVLGEPVSTATDVHALGLLLYELLSGHRARVIESTRPRAIEQAICETQPAAPSLACTTDRTAGTNHPAQSPKEIASARRLTPSHLQRRLRGDLDNIVMMALRREPERRYTTAQEMADDIRNFLALRPIRARPDRLSYRMNRYVRRHAAGVAITLAAVAAVALTVGYYTERLARERDAAQQAAERARVESARAEQVSAFLTGLFEASRPDQALGRELSARDLLDQGLERVDELAEEPEVQSRVISVIGKTHHRLSNYQQAEELYRQALEIRENHFGPVHVQVAESLNDLGVVLKDRGQLEAAQDLLARTVEMRRELLGESHEDLAISVEELGRLLRERGEYRKAKPLFEEGLEIRRRVYGDNHSETLSSLNSVAMMHRDLGDPATALPLFRELVAGYQEVKGENHPWTAAAMGNMAHALMDLERWQEAETLLYDALRIERDTLGSAHTSVAITLNHLGTVHREQSRLKDARAALQEAVHIARTSWGEEHPRLAGFLMNLGRVELIAGDFEAAEEALRESVAMHHRFFSGDDWRTAEAEGWLGRILAKTGRLEESETLLLGSHSKLVEHRGTDHPLTHQIEESIFHFYNDQGLTAKAGRFRPEAATSSRR